MAKITAAEVRKLAHLCRLRLKEEEIERYQKDLSEILEYVEILQNVDVEGLEPTSQVTGLCDVMRPDELIDYKTTPKELLKNAPAIQENKFKVKRMIG